ncbi:hypothetical protein EG028_25930 [Chitinophaga barathri]|uniref:Uncharacterized protein n=1 Tax=Chitinophaga barathri TaxID=1647451 RepID=A0A3N4MFA6_9BACT|nr:hypothetical protein EG028_25930 [Chitinophaga barathri]
MMEKAISNNEKERPAFPPKEDEPKPPNTPEKNTSEGCEFLDDTIRMKEQPLKPKRIEPPQYRNRL